MKIIKTSDTTAIVIIGLLSAFAITVKAQQNMDSTYRPDIYYPRLFLFREMPVNKKDVVFIGDSIIFWGDWTELLGLKKVKNRGIPGDTSFGLLERLGETVQNKPDAVFIMIGINDLAKKIPANLLLANYQRMIDTIRCYTPRTKIYIQSLLPVNEKRGKLNNHYQAAKEIPGVNNALKNMVAAAGAQYVDLYTLFADAEGNLKDSLTWDGVHLTAEGYKIWKDKLLQLRSLN